MNNIVTQDPYEALYDPETVQYAKVPRHIVEQIDKLVEASRGRTDVKTESDWVLVSRIFEFWTRAFPNEWAEFAEQVRLIKETRLNKQGYSPTKEIKYVGALPLRFERMIKTCFPRQQFDKSFVAKLTNNIKIVRVGEKTDTWFTVPEAPKKRKTVDEMVDDGVKLDDGNTGQDTTSGDARLVRNEKRTSKRSSTNGTQSEVLQRQGIWRGKKASDSNGTGVASKHSGE